MSEPIEAAVRVAEMLWVDSPRPTQERPLDENWFRQCLDEAAVVVTAFSSVGYQAALAGKRVIYYTELGGHRPVPLLDPNRFRNVREAPDQATLISHLRSVLAGQWPLDAAIEPDDDSRPEAIIGRLDEALASWRRAVEEG